MNQIGINTLLFTSPFTNKSVDWFPKFKKWGFDTVEIAVEDPGILDPILIKEALSKHGLSAVSVCAVMGLDLDLRGNEQQQMTSLKYLKDTIDFTEKLGAQLLAGPLYSSVGRADFVTPDNYKTQQKLVATHLKALSAYAARKSIKLAIEPLNRFETDFINTVDQALAMLTLVGSDNLYIHLDTFHMNIEEKNLDVAIRKAGDRLALLHACGSDRGTPGKDHTDWIGIRKALHDVHYNGQLVIESFTPEVKVIAKAASIWRDIESSGEVIATEGSKFLRDIISKK